MKCSFISLTLPVMGAIVECRLSSTVQANAKLKAREV
jgi:hypothetical protein